MGKVSLNISVDAQTAAKIDRYAQDQFKGKISGAAESLITAGLKLLEKR